MFFSRWHYSTVFGFSYLSCLWLHLRSVTFQPPPPLPEVSLGGALVVSVCASEVTGILLLPGSLLTPVSLLGTVRWTLLYPSSPWLWALLPQWGDGDNGGGGWFRIKGVSTASGVVRFVGTTTMGRGQSHRSAKAGGTRVSGPVAAAAQFSVGTGDRIIGSASTVPPFCLL